MALVQVGAPACLVGVPGDLAEKVPGAAHSWAEAGAGWVVVPGDGPVLAQVLRLHGHDYGHFVAVGVLPFWLVPRSC